MVETPPLLEGLWTHPLRLHHPPKSVTVVYALRPIAVPGQIAQMVPSTAWQQIYRAITMWTASFRELYAQGRIVFVSMHPNRRHVEQRNVGQPKYVETARALQRNAPMHSVANPVTECASISTAQNAKTAAIAQTS